MIRKIKERVINDDKLSVTSFFEDKERCAQYKYICTHLYIFPYINIKAQ